MPFCLELKIVPDWNCVKQGKLGSFGHNMLINCQQMVTRQGKFRQNLSQFPCYDLENIDYKPSGIDKTLRQVIMEITVRIPKKAQSKATKKKNKKKNKQAKATKDQEAMDTEEDNDGRSNMDEGKSKEPNEDTAEESKEGETELPYTEEKLFHCVMPCNKGKAAILHSQKNTPSAQR
jgi:hypothetical protein